MKYLKESLISVLLLFVLLPEGVLAQSILTKLQETEGVSRFTQAIIDTELDKRLSETGTFTIFAPSDSAYEIEMSKSNYSTAKLKAFLLNHIMTGWATERNLKAMSKATSLGGITLTIVVKEDNVEINGARIIKKNIKTKNGVIHVINKVLK